MRVSGRCAFTGVFFGHFSENELFPLEATRRNWEIGKLSQNTKSNKEVHRQLGIVTVAMALIIRRQGRAKRMAEQIQK